MLTRDRQIPLAGICILLGAYALGLQRQLPEASLPVPYAILAFLAIVLLSFRRTRYLGAFTFGFFIMSLAATGQISNKLDPALAGQELTLIGAIAGFPARSEGSLRFVVEPQNRPDLPRRIRLGWYGADFTPGPGELWHLNVRLRRPRGLANPDGFDFSAWLFRQDIGATGYVLDPGDNRRLLSARPDLISRVRQRFVARVAQLLPADSATAVLIAIGVGARHRISRQDWDAYAATGTTHLMAISGLHIGLAAGSFFLLGRLLLAPFCRRLNTTDLAMILAIVAAGVYALVSGFAVPARRALLMILLLALSVALRRRFNGTSILAISAVLVFLGDPVAILTPGFLMSFTAVAVLQISISRFARQDDFAGSYFLGRVISYTRRLSQLQFALLTGLFPLSVLIFDRFAIGAPLVNLVVLPVFNFVTVPFCLFGMLFDGPLQAVGDALLWCSYQSIRLVLALVRQVAAEPGLRFDMPALSPLMIAVACIPLIGVALPAGWPGRKIIILAIVAVVSYRPPAPPPGCFDYTTLDVGQGLSFVLQTARRTLVYDTGPAYRGGNDVAQLVVLPFLRSRGIRRVDKLVVSHADLDHSGGMQSLIRGIDVREVLVGEDLEVPSLRTTICRAGAEWDWDGVRFRILHPRNRSAWDGNNLSCVLLISIADHRILLTGDIEAPVEILLEYRSVLSQVSVVLVPHHGSRTSSSHALVDTLRPQLAIVAAGFANRWGMPKDEVVQRWQRSGARVVNTAYSGAISQRLCSGQPAGRVQQERPDSLRYWHDDPGDPY